MGYTALSKEFESSLREITMKNYGMTMTCHLKAIVDSDGAVTGYQPDLNNRCLKIVNGMVDIIGVITKTWNEKGEPERWIQTKATPTIFAGSRFKYLKPVIPFGYKEFVKALGDAIDEEERHGATVVDTIQTEVVESVNFADVRARASELWTQLISLDENNANVILKKVEITMGRKMKLSEFTEDQADLLALVVVEMEDMLK